MPKLRVTIGNLMTGCVWSSKSWDMVRGADNEGKGLQNALVHDG